MVARPLQATHAGRWPRRLDAVEGRSYRKEYPYRSAMITSKLTSKSQTTIPQPVRSALRLKAGDQIVYAIEGGVVVLRKAEAAGADDPFGTFKEWDSDADRKAYAKLQAR